MGCVPRQQMYVGRTTLMVKSMMMPVGRTKTQSTALQNRQMNTLVNLAMSERVISDAVQTMSSIGLKHSPGEMLGATTVAPIKNTYIIAVEVTLPDPKDAKVAADIVGAEIKKAANNLRASELGEMRRSAETRTQAASEQLDIACKALSSYEQGNKQQASTDPALIKLQGNVAAAKDCYTKAEADLAGVISEQKSAKLCDALATVDPAFVHPVR